MPVDVRLLGPLELWDGACRLAVGGVRQRTVLAALAVDVGRVVSMDRLVDAVYGADPPVTARQQIHSTVSALRRLLGAEIVTEPGGYRLTVAPRQVDVQRFSAGLADAGRASARGEPEEAVACLDAALALWSGPALDALPGLRAEAIGLEERRLAAREQRIDLRLGLGRYAEAVAELRTLVAEHPLRESLVGRLMLALHRTGRTPEAFAAYRELRAGLRAELGLEPGEGLRRLRDTLVRAPGAAAVGVPRSRVRESWSPGAASPPRPAQLPPDVSAFTGRSRALQALDGLLPDRAPSGAERDGAGPAVLVALTGPAGVGKTALAVHWAHRARERFPGGQLCADLHGYDGSPPARPADVLAGFLYGLGVRRTELPDDAPSAVATYRSLLAGTRTLILLDDVADAEQVRPLLPGAGGSLVLVTSRDRLDGLVAIDGARPVPLGALSPHEARTLLGRIAGSARAAAEPEAVDDLARLCGYLPLALRIAAANLAARPQQAVAGYVASLRNGDLLSGLTVEGDVRATPRRAFDVSYQAVPAADRRLFRLLGLAPRPDVTLPEAAALAGVTVEQARRSLEQLRATHLLEEREPGRFGVRGLLRAYAAERAAAEDGDDELAAALARLGVARARGRPCG